MGILKLFSKKTISLQTDNLSIQRIIPKCKEWKCDKVIIQTSPNCSSCKKYNKKIYSLFGWDKHYPLIPDYLLQRKCPDCGKIIGATMKVL